MMRFLRFVIILISAVGFCTCGAVSSSFLPGEEPVLQVEPRRWQYSIGDEFNKDSDLAVSLYRNGEGFSPVPMEDVTVKVGGDTADPSFPFSAANDEKYWTVTVSYPELKPVKYTITVGTPNGPNSGGGDGPTIVVTGGIEIEIGWE